MLCGWGKLRANPDKADRSSMHQRLPSNLSLHKDRLLKLFRKRRASLYRFQPREHTYGFQDVDGAAVEREWKPCKYFEDLFLKNGSSQGQNLVLTVSCVVNSLDSGVPHTWHVNLHLTEYISSMVLESQLPHEIVNLFFIVTN